jgi:outer membrane protein
MKKIVIILFLFIIGFCVIPGVSDAAAAIKIGIFDFQKVIDESVVGKATQKQLMERGSELQKKLQAEKDKLDKMNKAYENEKLVLSPDKKNEKETEMRSSINDFRRLQNDFEKEFKQLEAESLNKIQESVIDIVNDIGKQGNYTVVLERKAAGVIYFTDTIDITKTIIENYNKKANTAK